MRRIALIAAVLGLGLAGTAEAKPWLTFPQARNAVARMGRSDVARGWAASFSVDRCRRVHPQSVACVLTEHGAPAFGALWDDLEVYPTVRLVHGRIVVDDGLS